MAGGVGPVRMRVELCAEAEGKGDGARILWIDIADERRPVEITQVTLEHGLRGLMGKPAALGRLRPNGPTELGLRPVFGMEDPDSADASPGCLFNQRVSAVVVYLPVAQQGRRNAPGAAGTFGGACAMPTPPIRDVERHGLFEVSRRERT